MEDRILRKQRITGWLGMILILLGGSVLMGCPYLTERISSKEAVGQTYPAFLDFGGALTKLTFKLSNVGTGNFYWTIKLDPTDASDWLSVSSMSGEGPATLTATVDRTKLTALSRAKIRIQWALKETTVDVVCDAHTNEGTCAGTLVSPTAKDTMLVPFELSWKMDQSCASDLAFVITADGKKYVYGSFTDETESAENSAPLSEEVWSVVTGYFGTPKSGVFHWGIGKKSTMGYTDLLSSVTLYTAMEPFTVEAPGEEIPSYSWTDYWPLVVDQEQGYYWKFADPQGGATSYTLLQNKVDAITTSKNLTIYQVSTYVESDCSLFLESSQTITSYYVPVGDWLYRTTDSDLLDKLPDITQFERRFPLNMKPQYIAEDVRLEAGALSTFVPVSSYWPDLTMTPYSVGLYDVVGYDSMTDCIALSYKRSNGEWQPTYVFSKGQGIVINTAMSGDQSLMLPLPLLSKTTATTTSR